MVSIFWRISCISHLESGWLNQTFQNSTTSSVLFEPKLSSLRDDLCTWFFQLVLWKTCFYLQNECRARSSSSEILALLMYHPGIFLSWLDLNSLLLEVKSDISIPSNKNICLIFEVCGSSLADKRDNGQNFITKVIILCQKMSTISRTAFWAQLDGIHERL